MAAPTIPTFFDQPGGNVFTKPTGLANGDVLYLLYWSYHTSIGAASAPSGFSAVAGSTRDMAGSGQADAWIFRKLIPSAGGEPANYTVTRGAGTNSADGGRLLRVAGAHTTTPEDTTSTLTGNSALATTGTFSTTTADCLLLMAAATNGVTMATPSGMSVIYTHDGGDAYGFSQALTGTVTSVTKSGAISSNYWTVGLVAVAPVGGGGGPASKNNPLLGNPFQRLHRGAKV